MEGIVERLCENCIFAKPNAGLERIYCHRYPTIVRKDFGDFCGEFKDKWQVRKERVDP